MAYNDGGAWQIYVVLAAWLCKIKAVPGKEHGDKRRLQDYHAKLDGVLKYVDLPVKAYELLKTYVDTYYFKGNLGEYLGAIGALYCLGVLNAKQWMELEEIFD